VVFQALAAVGASLGVPRVGPAAKKAGGCAGGSRGATRDFDELFSLAPIKKIEGKKNDQEEEDTDGPEKALPESVPVLLGVKKNPEGQDQRNHIKEDENETHSGFSPKQRSPGISFEFRVPGFGLESTIPNPDRNQKLETRNPKPISSGCHTTPGFS
jgi:hypothetical protein